MNSPLRWLNRALLAGLAVAASAVYAATPTSATRVFSAGAAKSDITPELGAMIVGSTNSVPARHVHDKLHARALVLGDGTTRLAFVVCDLIGVPGEITDEAKKMILKSSSLPPSHVVIMGTHTHSAGSPYSPGLTSPDRSIPPVKPGPYQLFAARRIADAVQCAINNLEPARIGWGSGQEAAQVSNRRWYVKNKNNLRNPFGGYDQVRMNPSSDDIIDPAGPTDPEIIFISAQALNGRPIALLANYSMHYVGGVPLSDISADYYGAFSEKIGRLIGAREEGPAFVGMLSNGSSGDINNNNFRQRQVSLPPYEKIERVSNIIAGEVCRVYQTVQHQDWVPLDARYEEVSIGSRRPTPEMIARAKELLQRPAGSPMLWHARENSYAKRVLELERAPATIQAPLQALRVGDLAMVTFPLEVFVETGLEIKKQTPFAKSFTFSLANAYFGYLPTVAQHQLGGYETWAGTNRLEIAAAPKMTAVLLRFLHEMHSTAAPAR
ncbi:MAG: hypothetical protein RIQ93_2114 [Verrucomicrobiota bacterium]|jgi:hypothetical protein